MTKKQTAIFLFFLTVLVTIVLAAGLNYDTRRRYEATKAIVYNQPPVAAIDIANHEVLQGVNNSAHYWYGIGQSIFMLPGELGASGITKLLGVSDIPLAHALLVEIISFAPLNAAAIVLAFLLLCEFGFSLRQSALGALGLLFGTTFLYYIQSPQENNQILMLVLAGYYCHVLWIKHNKKIHLILGAAALGTLLIIRLTTLADIIAESLFVIGVLIWKTSKNEGWKAQKTRLLVFVGCQVLVIAFYGFLDRSYNYARFGSWTSNYINILAQQINSGLFNPNAFGAPVPDNWPFTEPVGTGTLGVLFSLQKSIFMYDPLLILLAVVVIVRRFKFDLVGELHYRTCFLLAGVASLIMYLFNYDKVTFWGGDQTWGARYHTSPVHMLCLLALPLTLEILPQLKRIPKVVVSGVVGFAIYAQLSSLFFDTILETFQAECGKATNFRLWERSLNIVNYVGGKNNVVQACSPGGNEDFLVVPALLPFQPNRLVPAQGQFALFLVWFVIVMVCMAMILLYLRYTRPRRREQVPTEVPAPTQP